MTFIAHRGNLRGPKPERENRIDYLNEALEAGFHVEADVWWHRRHFWLGHDEPIERIDSSFFEDERVWAHAKDTTALLKLMEHPLIHCFGHDRDDAVFTSHGYLWTYPGKPLGPNSICVMPEKSGQDWSKCYGVCSDYVADLKK